MEFQLTATECHLSYGITQCYHRPTQVNTPALTTARQVGTVAMVAYGSKHMTYKIKSRPTYISLAVN